MTVVAMQWVEDLFTDFQSQVRRRDKHILQETHDLATCVSFLIEDQVVQRYVR